MIIPGPDSKAPRLRHAVARKVAGTRSGTILAGNLGSLAGKAPASPRCGRTMARYEPTGWPPVLEDPVCGRPEGHNGPCRSAQAWTRQMRPPGDPGPCACGCGDLTAGWGPCKGGHHMRIREAA